jgi:hypothetical protein
VNLDRLEEWTEREPDDLFRDVRSEADCEGRSYQRVDLAARASENDVVLEAQSVSLPS